MPDQSLLELLTGYAAAPLEYFGYGKRPPPRVEAPVRSASGFGFEDPEARAFADRYPTTPNLDIANRISQGAGMVAKPFLAARDSLAEGVDLAQRAGLANSLAAVPVAGYEAAKHILTSVRDSAERLGNQGYTPGIDRDPNAAEDAFNVVSLAAGAGAPVRGAAAGESALARAGRPSESYSPSIGDRLIGKYLDRKAGFETKFEQEQARDPSEYLTVEAGVRPVSEAIGWPSQKDIGTIANEPGRPMDRFRVIDPSRLSANPEDGRGSLPGMIANASDRPTAGTTPLSERGYRLESAKQGLSEPAPYVERGDRNSTLVTSKNPGGEKYFADIALRQARGDYDKALALLKDNPEAANVLRYWKDAGYSFRAYEDPARSQSYWNGLDEFNRAQPPFRLSANPEDGRGSLPGMIGNAEGEAARRGGRRVEFTPDMKQAFKEGWENGTSLESIADRLGVDVGTVQRRMGELKNELGLSDRGSGAFWAANEDRFREMWNANVPVQKIADELGSNKMSVYEASRRLGLPERDLSIRNEADLVERVRQMRNDGHGYRDIANELGITKNKAIGIGNRLRQSGADILANPEDGRGSLPGAVANALDQGGTTASRNVEKVTPASEMVGYHGARDNFKEFDTKKINLNTAKHALGMYVSPGTEWASRFGEPGAVYGPRPSKTYIWDASTNDFEGRVRDAKKIFPQYEESFGWRVHPAFVSRWTEALKRAGYDAVQVMRNGKHQSTVLLYPERYERRGDRSSGAADAPDSLNQGQTTANRNVEKVTPASAQEGGILSKALGFVRGGFRQEMPVDAASKVGEEIYRGPIHAIAMGQAIDKIGLEGVQDLQKAGKVVDGFFTNRGRFVTRAEAADLVNQAHPDFYDRYAYSKKFKEQQELDAAKYQDKALRRGDRSTGAADAPGALKPDDTLYSNKDRAGIVGAAANAVDRAKSPLRMMSDAEISAIEQRNPAPFGDLLYGTEKKNTTPADNFAAGAKRHWIMRGDEPVGFVTVLPEGNTAHIAYMKLDDAAKERFGMGDMRALREEFRKIYPEINKFEGYRISGAHSKTDKKKQSVTIKSDGTAGEFASALNNVPGQDDQQDTPSLKGFGGRVPQDIRRGFGGPIPNRN